MKWYHPREVLSLIWPPEVDPRIGGKEKIEKKACLCTGVLVN
jgi:hypothetical protein